MTKHETKRETKRQTKGATKTAQRTASAAKTPRRKHTSARGKAAGAAAAEGGGPTGAEGDARRTARAPVALPGQVMVSGVRLTHPDRMLYPEVGVKKIDLARFYELCGPAMVPHVEDRPLTVVRAPSGVTGKTFYVRHVGDSTPGALREVTIPSGSAAGTSMIADDVPALVVLAQMNVLEIHAWNARFSHIETPDRLVFDLDPGPQVPWSHIVEGARHVRAALELLDLESFVKTTGSKGLHVVVPLLPQAGWEEALEFSRVVAQAIVHAQPQRYSVTITKAGREDKILIDYLRNRRGSTSVSVYSSRARPTAPVSVPVAWEQLTGDVPFRADSFRVGEAAAWFPSRVDPWKGYSRVRQKLTTKRLQQAATLRSAL